MQQFNQRGGQRPVFTFNLDAVKEVVVVMPKGSVMAVCL
jgi:hypothetical protein